MSRIGLFLLQMLVAIAVVALWQFFASVPVFGKVWLPPFFFSNPVDVFSQVIKWFYTGVIWTHLAITLWESILAFVIGSLGGVAVGFWFARQPVVAAVFDPYVKMANALPRVVLAPIFTLWLGLVQGRARRDADVLHRLLQRLSGRQGSEPDRAQ
jgi:NitT/TauT family transport system permease protein